MRRGKGEKAKRAKGEGEKEKRGKGEKGGKKNQAASCFGFPSYGPVS
jgi:hypothetical protein